jgi:hypothetical protein
VELVAGARHGAPGALLTARTLRRPLLAGFLTGVLLLFVSTLGLVIGLVEFLQPLLAPGAEILRGRAEALPFSPWIAAIALNGSIYAALFVSIAAARRRLPPGPPRAVGTGLVLLVFLVLTGTAGDILALLRSGDASGLFGIGA